MGGTRVSRQGSHTRPGGTPHGSMVWNLATAWLIGRLNLAYPSLDREFMEISVVL